MHLHVDLETRSSVDLRTRGVYNYFDSPDADVLCCAYAEDGKPVELWTPGMPVPEVFYEADMFYAHNAAFERIAFEKVLTPKYGFPTIKLEEWFCTAYQSRCSNMPSALGNAARCLGTKDQKDKIGEMLIKECCIPPFNDDPALLEQLYQYCKQDVLTEQAITRQLRPLTQTEIDDYHVNERMNDNGLRVDLPLCTAAMSYAREEEADLIQVIEDVTEGEVSKVRGTGLKNWCLKRLSEDHIALITDSAGKISFDKRNREKLLAEDIPANVRTAIEATDAVGKSSVAKFRAMQARASADERVRGIMIAAGAAQTGRASSLGIQIQNFPRETAKNPLAIRKDLLDDIHPEDIVGEFGGNIMSILSSMLRPAILPEDGNIFLDCDYSSIENRVGPWLTDSPEGEAKLDQFRQGIDPYLVAASDIYGEEVKKGDDRRQTGKVAELSLGYGGGVGAFSVMAQNYGVTLPEYEVRQVVEKWRLANRWAVNAWEGLERAFTQAFRNPGEMFRYGRIKYCAVKNILAGGTTVFCELPCGRFLTYPDVTIEDVETRYGWRDQITYLRANWTPRANERRWPRAKLWGGTLFENVTQAAAASLMRFALRELDAAGAKTVAAVHDQALIETSLDEADHWEAVLHKAMNTTPDWATGLPVVAEVERRERFGK